MLLRIGHVTRDRKSIPASELFVAVTELHPAMNGLRLAFLRGSEAAGAQRAVYR
jgi:hypothetical protein